MARSVFLRSGPVKRSSSRTERQGPVTIKISDTDRGMADLLLQMLSQGLTIGIIDGGAEHQGRDGQGSGITVGELAAIHEFGLGVPRRSFLADWFDENKQEIENFVVRGGRAIVRGKLTAEQFMDQFGQWAVGSIQERMSNNIPPPLAPETIARKGSSVALIDTGQLRSSISYKVDSSAIPSQFRAGGAGAGTSGGVT
jgi:hypothetical protein